LPLKDVHLAWPRLIDPASSQARPDQLDSPTAAPSIRVQGRTNWANRPNRPNAQQAAGTALAFV